MEMSCTGSASLPQLRALMCVPLTPGALGGSSGPGLRGAKGPGSVGNEPRCRDWELSAGPLPVSPIDRSTGPSRHQPPAPAETGFGRQQLGSPRGVGGDGAPQHRPQVAAPLGSAACTHGRGGSGLCMASAPPFSNKAEKTTHTIRAMLSTAFLTSGLSDANERTCDARPVTKAKATLCRKK